MDPQLLLWRTDGNETLESRLDNFVLFLFPHLLLKGIYKIHLQPLLLDNTNLTDPQLLLWRTDGSETLESVKKFVILYYLLCDLRSDCNFRINKWSYLVTSIVVIHNMFTLHITTATILFQSNRFCHLNINQDVYHHGKAEGWCSKSNNLCCNRKQTWANVVNSFALCVDPICRSTTLPAESVRHIISEVGDHKRK